MSVILQETAWDGCYNGGWQGEIVPGAFAHPAKVSRALIRRIYEHAFAEGWLRAGDVVCDPFGGIAGTALDALWNGLAWVGVELEPRFVALADANLDLWRRKYGSKPGFGSARILQGDSRKLNEITASADLVCSSPPYCDQPTKNGGALTGWTGARRVGASQNQNDGYGETAGQLGAMKEGEPPRVDCVISSPPYCNDTVNERNGIDRTKMADGRPGGPNSQAGGLGYGREPGQLGSMPEGKFDAVVSSPPYVSGGHHPDQTGAWNTSEKYEGRNRGLTKDQAGYGKTDGQMGQMPEGRFDAVVGSPPFSHPNEQPIASQSRLLKEGYEAFKSPAKMARGSTDGNLESMPEGRFDAVVSSPPFEGSLAQSDSPKKIFDQCAIKHGRTFAGSKKLAETEGYGSTDGNIGNQSGDTFWAAAREIVAQCHLILRPGGHAIFVCKDFVRKGKRVPFSDQWQTLCESQGFRLVCRHRAMLVAHYGEQDDMLGEAKQLKTERKSFFRRLAEKKGSPAIDFEDVICLERR